MRNSFREIAAFMDPVAPARSLRKLLGMHLLEESDGYKEVWRRHNHPNGITQRFFTFNTYLMDIPGAGRKPAVEYRDAEIGKYTADNFDICCLSEVWLREERIDLLEQWPASAHVEHESGGAAWINLRAMLGSSGLMTISRTHEIHRKNFYAYKNESGADKNAKKGCLLTVLTPFAHETSRTSSSLNIYSTHMNASGDAKNKQVFELVKFIWETMDKQVGDTSRPGRPGLNNNILCGDFNLDRYQRGGSLRTADVLRWSEVRALPTHLQRAVNHEVLSDGTVTNNLRSAKTAFHLLRDLLSVLGFKDLWATRNGSAGYTSNLPTSPIASNVPIRDSEFPFYCDDTVVPNTRTSDRPTAIDHLFVTGATANTSFTIDFTRPRRPFTVRPDSAADLDDIRFMSDHLGISTTIMLTPK